MFRSPTLLPAKQRVIPRGLIYKVKPFVSNICNILVEPQVQTLWISPMVLRLAVAEPLAHMLRQIRHGFVNKGSKRPSFFLHLKFEMNENYKYIKRCTKIVFGCFYVVTRFAIAK